MLPYNFYPLIAYLNFFSHSFLFSSYLFCLYEYTVAVFRYTRRGSQISLQMAVRHLWLLEIELRTCGRAASAPNHQAIFPAPYLNS